MTSRIALFAIFMGLAQFGALPLVAGPARAENNQDTEEMHWRNHASDLRAKRAAAEERYREAKDAYLFAQNRRQLIKGEQRQAIIDEYNASKDALANVEKALEDLPEEARRAGAHPGWIRE